MQSEGSEAIKIFVQAVSGHELAVLHVELNQTVLQIKELVIQKCKVPIDQVQLVCSGNVLEDGDTVGHCGLHGPEAVLQFVRLTPDPLFLECFISLFSNEDSAAPTE